MSFQMDKEFFNTVDQNKEHQTSQRSNEKQYIKDKIFKSDKKPKESTSLLKNILAIAEDVRKSTNS